MGTPNTWLSKINPGFGPDLSKWQGLDFFTNNLIPFLISGAIFLVIVLSLIFLIWGGIMWITSSGNKEGLAKAKNTVTYALVGLALGILSIVILNVIGQFFDFNLTGVTSPAIPPSNYGGRVGGS